MKLIDEAEGKLAGLRYVPPQHATKATVDAYQRAIELLAERCWTGCPVRRG